MGAEYAEPLTPEGWLLTGHAPGTHVWAPPPAAAHYALKQVAQARLKRPYTTTHVILIPRLLYREEWQARFEKETDIWFAMSTGA